MDNKKTVVGLVQISSDFLSHSYLPYSVGILESYAKKHLAKEMDLSFLPTRFDRDLALDNLSQLAQADVLGFSVYLWNEQISLTLARKVKALNPEIVIAFGGPQVPRRAEQYLRAHEFIDIACQGEGELPFLAILKNYQTRTWESVPSASFILQDGSFKQTALAPRINDLIELPSPFLDGVFENLIEAFPKKHWIATWETNRGCPFSCTFCDFGSATASKVRMRKLEELEREVEWFAKNQIDYVFCADANFGMLPRDIEIAHMLAKKRLQSGFPRALSVENAKNVSLRSLEVQKILTRCGLSTGTVLSVQTLHQPTLVAIERSNIPLKAYHEAQQWCSRENISTMTDLILGLPEESYDSFVSGIETLLENGQHNRIQFNTLAILPNAEMGKEQYLERYGMQLQTIPVVNQHGTLRLDSELIEQQTVVVASNSLPQADWIKSRAMCWVTGLLHFDKLLQIPLIVLRHAANISYRELLEFFAEKRFNSLDPTLNNSFPVLTNIIDRFLTHAAAVTQGAAEYVPSKEHLGIWWPLDEYALIELYCGGKIELFYLEAQRALTLLLDSKKITFPAKLLEDALTLNQAALKVPNRKAHQILELSWNIHEFYRGVLDGKPVDLEAKQSKYKIECDKESWPNTDDWLRKVIWYQNKTAGYLYKIKALSKEVGA